MSEPKYGDLIFVDHGFYKHFGIYINSNCVIHYDGKIDDKFLRNMCVRQTNMDRFLAGKSACKVISIKTPISPHDVVKRAKDHIDDQNFNLIFNNCEHFAYWCKTGHRKSDQVQLYIFLLSLLYILNIY